VSAGYVIVWAEGVTDPPRATYGEALAAVRGVLSDPVIGHSNDILEGGERTFFWASAEPAGNANGLPLAGYIEARHDSGPNGYVEMVSAAGQLAADIFASLPVGDDASPEEQVDAQSDPVAVALEHDWPAGRFRELVIEALARFQAEGVDRD
jgi:hypothetical protein